VTSLRDVLGPIFADTQDSIPRTFVDHNFREVDDDLNWVLNTMQGSGWGWILIIETMHHQNRYVQALVEPTGLLWAECVSNGNLTEENRFDDEQCEVLAKLGWEYPSAGMTNWNYHDELCTGTAVAGLMSRTIRRVFEVGDSDKLRFELVPNGLSVVVTT